MVELDFDRLHAVEAKFIVLVQKQTCIECDMKCFMAKIEVIKKKLMTPDQAGIDAMTSFYEAQLASPLWTSN